MTFGGKKTEHAVQYSRSVRQMKAFLASAEKFADDPPELGAVGGARNGFAKAVVAGTPSEVAACKFAHEHRAMHITVELGHSAVMAQQLLLLLVNAGGRRHRLRPQP